MTSSKWPPLKEGAWSFASFSDLHLGHRRNDIVQMIKGLDESIFTSGLLTYVKVLFLAGDVFDRLLSLDDPSVQNIDRWIARLLRACAEHGVTLRVLEGTPSHDRRQSARFETILELLDIQLDFRYVTAVEIEYVAVVKSWVLYVPDEAYPTTMQTQEVVRGLLKSKGLDMVDVAVMHGYFQYQLPYQTKEGSYHDLAFYESIVRKWITIGHVHSRSRMGKALAQGSHDCHGHGEEEDKGYVVATVGNGNDDAWFMNNPHAHIYRTLEVYDLDTAEAIALADEVAAKLPAGSRLRIQADPEHPVFEHIVQLQVSWPHLVMSKHQKSRGEKTIAEKVLEDVISHWVPIRIDNTNIVELIGQRMLKRKLDETVQARLLRRLKECA